MHSIPNEQKFKGADGQQCMLLDGKNWGAGVGLKGIGHQQRIVCVRHEFTPGTM